MANQYVKYGATAALGVGLAGAAKGVSSLASSASAGWQLGGGGTGNIAGGVSGAIDAMAGGAGGAASAALGAMKSTLTNPAFLTGAGLGLAGMLLGSGSKRPSLNIPNVAAATAVALNVGNLIQQGKAAALSYANAKAGMDITSTIGQGLALSKSNSGIVSETVSEKRASGKTFIQRFPLDLSTEYFVRFAFYDYSRVDLKSRSVVNYNPHTTIRLPIPSNLVDAMQLAYSDVNLGQFAGAAFQGLIGTSGASPSELFSRSFSQQAGEAVGGLTAAISDPGFIQALARRLASSVDPGFGTAFDLATGTAPNPHVALAFNGIALKRYQFSWRFSPNSLEESKHLQEIIRSFQVSSMPTKQGNFMLGYPNVVNVEISPSNLFIFKKMMIDNVTVNYAPNGVPSFFSSDSGHTYGGLEFDGQSRLSERYPTEVVLTISLREVDIHTANDPEWKPYGIGRSDLEEMQVGGIGAAASANPNRSPVRGSPGDYNYDPSGTGQDYYAP